MQSDDAETDMSEMTDVDVETDEPADTDMMAESDMIETTDTSETDTGEPSPDESLCAKYGGADNVASVVQNNVIGAIAGDCRINTFFTSLTEDAFVRVNECLTIQVQELFGCDGIAYDGAEASNGLPCRSMKEAHLGLSISTGDFDALIEDVVAGLMEAGVEDEDIAAAAPALLGMEEDIVESEGAEPSDMQCMLSDEEPDGGAPSSDGGTDDAGAAP